MLLLRKGIKIACLKVQRQPAAHFKGFKRSHNELKRIHPTKSAQAFWDNEVFHNAMHK